MDIAQVCTRYYPTIDGAETYVREISERLAKKGFNIENELEDSLSFNLIVLL